MNTKISAFTIRPFRNRNGVISHRVSGWLLGERIRRNFKSREDAIIGRNTLILKQAQVESSQRIVSTSLTEAQLREAEAAFHKIKDAPRSLSFYLNHGFENYREPKACMSVADAILLYLTERAKDVAQALISQRQLDAIRVELTAFQKHFPQGTLAELTTEKFLEYIQRDGGALKTQNNRRAVLLTLFKFAQRQGWLVTNPLKGTTRHRIDHGRGIRART